MKTTNSILALLATAFIATSALAQTSEPEWHIYSQARYGSSWGIWPHQSIEKITFSNTNYDLYAYSIADIAEDGHWTMTAVGYGEMSIARTKIGIVAAEVPDSLVEQQFLQGKIPNLQEAPNDTATNRKTFVVEDGSYKPVIFGFDRDGNYRGCYVGNVQTFADTPATALGEPLIAIAYDVMGASRAYDWGYGSIMHLRDVMGEDYAVIESGYDWYSSWAANSYMGAQYASTQFIWCYFDMAITQTNDLLARFIRRSKLVNVDAMLGAGLALRAMLYLDAARMYEFLPNDKVSDVNEAGYSVLGLTFPIGTSAELWGKDVLRATREDMAAYILADLDQAETLLANVADQPKTMANLTAVYGLKARLYLWTGNYLLAKQYADKAIASGKYTPLNRNRWLNTTNGFNDSSAPAWIWAMTYPQDSAPVSSGILNWTSWSSNEYENGYAAAGPYVMMGKAVYDRISDSDFRKLSYKAPYGSALYGQDIHISNNYDLLPDYASLKFRPGQGETLDATTACTVDVPLMRIEEMYFISAEADAQLGDLTNATATLKTIMQTRDANYTYTPASKEALIDEIFQQKRVELWGEGLNYFDYKRLNRPVTRGYVGSNFGYDRQFNTTTRPAWMNFVFVQNAYNGQIGDWNNPDPSGCYETANY